MSCLTSTPSFMPGTSTRNDHQPNRYLAAATFCCSLSLSSGVSQAQCRTLKIKVLDSHTGKPVARRLVLVEFDRETMADKRFVTRQCQSESYAKLTDDSGETSFVVADFARKIELPIYYPEIGEVSCPKVSVNIATAASRGIVGTNKCGRATSPPTPGQVTVFAREPTWFEKLRAKLAGS